MASRTLTASVPSTPSSSPAAIAIGGGVPRTICSASSTADSASWRLWETTTIPTMSPPVARVGVACGRHGEAANAAAADWSSNAADVAPGSWWPALRSPR